MTFRDIKTRARLGLHDHMRQQSLLYRGGPNGPSQTIYCRVHSKVAKAGDLRGTSLSYAETVEVQPRLVFLVEDCRPVRGDVYIIGPDEGYRADHIEPPDGVTITAVCVRMSSTEVSTYSAPE